MPPNLVLNPSFEDDTAWTLTGGALYTLSEAYDGDRSVRMNAFYSTFGPAYGNSYLTQTITTPFAPGTVYLRFRVKGVGSPKAFLRLTDWPDTTQIHWQAPSSGSPDWVTITLPFPPPVLPYTFAFIALYGNTTSTYSVTWYLDLVEFYSPADGDPTRRPECSWPSTFRGAFQDTLSGRLVKEDKIVRDTYGRLVDPLDLDDPGRDEL
jgi:hypothetical protein